VDLAVAAITFPSVEKLWNLSDCLLFILFGYIHYLCFKIDPDPLSEHFFVHVKILMQSCPRYLDLQCTATLGLQIQSNLLKFTETRQIWSGWFFIIQYYSSGFQNYSSKI
jgi:hypothetical protein